MNVILGVEVPTRCSGSSHLYTPLTQTSTRWEVSFVYTHHLAGHARYFLNAAVGLVTLVYSIDSSPNVALMEVPCVVPLGCIPLLDFMVGMNIGKMNLKDTKSIRSHYFESELSSDSDDETRDNVSKTFEQACPWFLVVECGRSYTLFYNSKLLQLIIFHSGLKDLRPQL